MLSTVVVPTDVEGDVIDKAHCAKEEVSLIFAVEFHVTQEKKEYHQTKKKKKSHCRPLAHNERNANLLNLIQ